MELIHNQKTLLCLSVAHLTNCAVSRPEPMVHSSLDTATKVRYLTVKQSKDHTILKVLHQHVLSYNPKTTITLFTQQRACEKMKVFSRVFFLLWIKQIFSQEKCIVPLTP